MDHSPLSRRGALAAAAGSAVALTVPATARAGTPAEKDGKALASVNTLLSNLSKDQRLRIVHTDKQPTRKELDKRAARRKAFGDPYSTHGWDTVSAVRLSDVNRAIAKADAFPKNWGGKIPGSIFSSPIVASGGNFGTWATTLGGSGEFLTMQAPFEVELTVGESGPDQQTLTISKAMASLQVNLEVINPRPGSKSLHQLMVRRTPPDKSAPPVVVTSLSYTVSPPPQAPGPDPMLDGVLKELLEGWFAQNMDQFEHVFATANLSGDGAGDLAWLQPTLTGYAIHDGMDASGKYTLDNSFLGMLNMTEKRALPATADNMVDGTAILSGQRAGLNISSERFMSKMVIPAMAASLKASADTFKLLADNTIQCTSLDLPQITVDGDSYTPHVTNLHIYSEAAELYMDMDVTIHISPGIDAEISSKYSLSPQLTTVKGEQYVTYSGKLLNQQSSTVVAAWVQWTEAIAGVVVGCVGAGEFAAAETIFESVMVVVVSLVTEGVIAVMKVITELPAGKVPDGLPSIQTLLTNAAIPLQWASATEFVPAVASFDGGFQLGGDCFK